MTRNVARFRIVAADDVGPDEPRWFLLGIERAREVLARFEAGASGYELHTFTWGAATGYAIEDVPRSERYAIVAVPIAAPAFGRAADRDGTILAWSPNPMHADVRLRLKAESVIAIEYYDGRAWRVDAVAIHRGDRAAIALALLASISPEERERALAGISGGGR